ncbi:MAG TPA: hypothetical protein VMG10_12060 [Gemmataceae bacterium]|nr:hypothetical protein [Gemmataceae bacterium]
MSRTPPSPESLEQQRREDRYREIATVIDRGQKPPFDAKAAVLEILNEMQQLFVVWPVCLVDKIEAALDQKALTALAKVDLTQHILDFSLGYVRWKGGLRDQHCLRGYVLRRWPMLWERIEAVWQAYCPAISPGDLYQFLQTRPAEEQLKELGGKAAMLDGWIERYKGTIQQFGLSTTDDGEEEISLDDEDVSILQALQKRAPLRLSQDQIEAATSPRISKRTIATRMPRLVAAGLVAQPEGEKKGYILTQQGRDLLEKLGKS